MHARVAASEPDEEGELLKHWRSPFMRLIELAIIGAAFAYWTYKNASDVPQMKQDIKGLQTDMGWVKDSLGRIEVKLDQ